MKKVIMLMGMMCMATSALAFGGGGSGHDSTKYNRHNPGVDNFGVHIHPDNPPLDIRFYDIKNDANAQLCQEGANVYCCKEGYVVDVATSKCVACPDGSVASLEENFKCTVCAGEMMPNQDKSSCIMPEPTCEGTVCGANCCPTGTTCTEGKCCADDVRDENGENIGCAPEGQDLYCSRTAENGQCSIWATCPKGKESTKDWIVGMPNAFGACAYNDGDDVYCYQAGPSGCNAYAVCTDMDGEVGKDLEAYAKHTGHDVGGEVCCPEGKFYCQVAFLDGTCEHHACQAYEQGELTQGIYGALDVICPEEATPYISKLEMIDVSRFEGSCCYGTVEPGNADQGIEDTCIE